MKNKYQEDNKETKKLNCFLAIIKEKILIELVKKVLTLANNTNQKCRKPTGISQAA